MSLFIVTALVTIPSIKESAVAKRGLVSQYCNKVDQMTTLCYKEGEEGKGGIIYKQ